MKKLILLIMMSAMLLFTACGYSKPCESYGCDATPTKKYENDNTGTVHYVCNECAADCQFCSQKATKHYWSLLDVLIFVCQDCYDYVSN